MISCIIVPQNISNAYVHLAILGSDERVLDERSPVLRIYCGTLMAMGTLYY
jgi:hypothetical protein